MAYVYTVQSTKELKTGDKVLLRDGFIRSVTRVNPITVRIADLFYDEGSGVANIDPKIVPNNRDVIWVLSKTPQEIKFSDYKIEVGQYVIGEGDEVFKVAELDPTDQTYPIRLLRLSTGAFRWYRDNGKCGTTRCWPRIIEVCDPKKEVNLNLNEAKPGDKLRLKNGDEVRVEVNDRTSCPVYAGSRWYLPDGQTTAEEFRAVKLIKQDPTIIKRVDLTNAKVGDRLRLRNGQIRTITEIDASDAQAPVSAEWWYRNNGVRLVDYISQENDRDVVELIKKEIERVDLTKVKKGDRLRTRDGRIAEVTRLDLPDPRACVYVGAPLELWYDASGVCNIDRSSSKENAADIVEILPKADAANSSDKPYKELLLAVLSDTPAGELINLQPSLLLDLIKDAHADVTPNKVSTAFVALLEGFSASNQPIKIPASYLKDLVEL